MTQSKACGTSLQIELFKKEWGMETSARPHEAELERARFIARQISLLKGQVSINDVREALPLMESGNWLGSVFKGKEWVSVGFTQAIHKDSHAHTVRIWRLR